MGAASKQGSKKEFPYLECLFSFLLITMVFIFYFEIIVLEEMVAGLSFVPCAPQHLSDGIVSRLQRKAPVAACPERSWQYRLARALRSCRSSCRRLEPRRLRMWLAIQLLVPLVLALVVSLVLWAKLVLRM